MRRQLRDFVRVERVDVKSHDLPPHGRVAELHPCKDYGRLETRDGRVIDFHRNSAVNGDFDQLEVGTVLRFVEEMGDVGSQARSIIIGE